MSDLVPARNYCCYSPLCDGEVKGLDKEPKPHGLAAICWACGSDLYTVPRYGATQEHVESHPKIDKRMLTSIHMPYNPINWQQMFAGMIVSRPQGQSD